MELFDLSWLVGDRVSGAEYLSDSDMWLVRFESGSSLSIECLWRLIRDGELRSTSLDHGQRFGLPKSFDGVAALGELRKHRISAASVRYGTADITLNFGESVALEVLPTSGGYESWSANHPQLGTVFVAAGGQIQALPRTYSK